LEDAEVGNKILLKQLKNLKPEFAKAAQRVYEQWEQDEDGVDPELGAGGICQDVADAMADVVLEYGVGDVEIVDNNGVGEQHVWIVVYNETGEAYHVDIPPSVYEIGSGYKWRKNIDVEIKAEDVSIWEAEDFSPEDDYY